MILVTSLSLLAIAVAWISWSNLRSKLAYDLNKIRGPPAWPLIGNLNEVRVIVLTQGTEPFVR